MRSFVIVTILFSTSLYGQDAREIVNHYLDTVSNGNINNWSKIKSVYSESEVYYSQNDFTQKVDLLKPAKSSFHKSFRVLPDNYKTEIYEDSTFTKLTSTIYFLKDKTIILLSNALPMIKEPTVRDEFYSTHLPVQISKLVGKSKSIELLGIREFPSQKLFCYEIKMTTKGRTYILNINKETFLLEYWNGRDDEDLSIMTGFKNYKRVGGLLIPMTEFMTKNEIVYFRSDTRKIEINSSIDSQIFEYIEKK